MTKNHTHGVTGAAAPTEALVRADTAPPASQGHPRVERIMRLRHPGVFADFTWPTDLFPFKRLNLIYGWNGSGKTTLSEIFRHLEERVAPVGCQVSLRVDGHDLSGDAFPASSVPVRVFNREYVRKSVFPEGGGELPLILVLGKENVEKQKHVTELKAKIAELQKGLGAGTQDATKSDRAVEDFCAERAAAIKDALRATGSAYNNYDKRGFRQRAEAMQIAGDASSHTLSDADRERTIAQHRGARRDSLTPLAYAFPDWASLAKDVIELSGQTVEAKAIATLKDDRELAHWTQDGLRLHETRTAKNCLFCEQPLPQHRLEDLASHFSSAFRDLEARVAALTLTITGHISAIDALAIPKRSELFDDLAGDYEAATAKLMPQLANMRTALEAAKAVLDAKRQSPFDSVAATLSDPHADVSVLAGVNDVIRQHNDACAAFETRTVEARKKLESHAVAEALPDFASKLSDSTAKNAAVNNLRAEIKKLDEEVAEIEREIVQHRRPAEEFNADLRNYLGHGELQLAIRDSGYEVMRSGQPAMGLSEGERTAIALLYFLKSLEDRGFDLANGVVVLDDPVSSLDANSLFLAFGFIQLRLKDAGQLVVLTHNFSFFRLMRRWLLKRGPDKKPRKDAALFMLETRIEQGRRLAALGPLAALLKDYESEYHYLFSVVLKVAGASPAVGLDELYVLPNVARRLLEAFLAFRDPTDDGLEPKVMRMRGDEAKKLRVLRFLHVHSHGEGMTEPEHDPSQLAEAGNVLRDLMELLKVEDSQHFDAMAQLCQSDAATASERGTETPS